MRARVGMSSGSAYARSIASRARSSRRLDSSTARLTPRSDHAGPSELDAPVVQPSDRVDLLAVLAADAHLEVQVRAGRAALVAQERDRLAGVHVLTGLDQDLDHVPVDGHVTVLMEDVHRLAVAAGRTGPQHDAVGRRVLRRPHRRGEVDALVELAPPGAEGARQAGALDGQHRL